MFLHSSFLKHSAFYILHSAFLQCILAVFLWAAALSGTAEARSRAYSLLCASNDYMSGDDVANWNAYVGSTAKWMPTGLSNNPWLNSEQWINYNSLEDGIHPIQFSRIQDFYKPGAVEDDFTNSDTKKIRYYQIYSNSLSVVINGVNAGTNATWQIAQFAEFTNSTAYSTTYTDSQNLSPIPTGSYAITFNNLSGYTKPGPVTTNISAALANYVTGAYSRIFGNLQISMTPGAAASNAPWILSTYPYDFTVYTNKISGSGNYIYYNVPIGSYTVTFQELSGYTAPSLVSGTVYSNVSTIITGAYTFAGYQLVVHLGAPFIRQSPSALPGIGSGPCRVEYGSTIATQTAAVATYAVNADNTVTLTALTNYVYKWYINTGGGTAAGIDSAVLFSNSYSFIMVSDYDIWLLYSTPYNTYDNAGDIDYDRLPDRWEITWFGDGGNTESAAAPQAELSTNTYANGDNDFIPSASTNPPALVSVDTNNGVVTYSGAGGSIPDYPLLRTRFLSQQEAGAGLGYATGLKFNNLLECRGFDGYYLTNGPTGWVVNDDPLTSPSLDDTDNDSMTDGWEYYFWYWRSAEAYSAGFTNSANLSWVTLKPTVWNMNDHDTDGDGYNIFGGLDDLAEHDYGTDPTHCDTDGDAMDDYWEITFTGAGSNALDYVNNGSNPDGDFMAWVNQGVLVNGTVGTALGTNICYLGASNNPSAAWWDLNRNNVFDLYYDVILKASPMLTNDAAGTRYAFTNYYGTSAGLSGYKDGYPVWVAIGSYGSYTYSTYTTNILGTNYVLGTWSNSIPLVNPRIKHDAIYRLAPASSNLYPGVCSFNPYTAWTNIALTSATGVQSPAPDTVPYTTYQEYLGGDYIGRLSWDAGGQRSALNDEANSLNRNSYSEPQNQDADADQMPDGWELYVGLNDNSGADAVLDSDDDELNNRDEWANATHSLGSSAATWSNKLLPTDPGIITAPSPNDPHPKDTDWDGLLDGLERTPNANPTAWDTDGDFLPDGWENYAGSSVTNSDAKADPDGDGLLNYEEYWCAAIPEFMMCDPGWQENFFFCSRRAMTWDPFAEPAWGRAGAVFIPPDYFTDPCFMYANGIYNDLADLRANYSAATALSIYHTPFANDADSDGDDMDDYWEVYHGLNPCRGATCLVADNILNEIWFADGVAVADADLATAGYQYGLEGGPFNSLAEYILYVEPNRYDVTADTDYARIDRLLELVGPFNLSLDRMDPDGDGLPNLEEYSYDPLQPPRPFYHTDPSPIWMTTIKPPSMSYWGRTELVYWWTVWNGVFYPFEYEYVEGYDTDNDGVSDYAEINSAAGQSGNNPLDERNPIRNRALYFNGTNDFARQVDTVPLFIPGDVLTRFCVEAWIKPDNPARSGNQVVFEKAGLYRNPFNPSITNVAANFRMGVTNGLPYVLYNGRGSLRAYQATAQTKHRIQTNTNWTHVAGSYDGTNLVIYVNGEESSSLRTTEIPANGYDVWISPGLFLGTDHLLIVGARDNRAGKGAASPADFFGGCIDEIRVWDGARTRADILANKDRRLTQSDIINNMTAINKYFTFDDVPDPNHRNSAGVLDEPVAPAGMNVDDMHPAIGPSYSTVYTGVSSSYNYIVYANDHGWHSRPITPPADDYWHWGAQFDTNGVVTNITTNTVVGYVNPGNPYHFMLNNEPYIYDLLLHEGTRAVATNSWLSGLTGDPDSTDADGDGLPDWWEQLYNLDPNDATGDNGAWGDVDHDGLNNRGEYLAGTNPRLSDTDGDGIGDYDSRSGPYTRTWGEMFMDGDGMPDTWEMQYGLDPYHYDAQLDLDKDGWSNYAEYQAGTNPNDAGSYPQPAVSGSADYFGDKSGTFRFYVYATNTMDGEPLITQVGAGQQVAETIGNADGTLYFSGRLPLYPIDQTTVVRISALAGTNAATITFTFTSPTAYTYSGVGSDYSATLNYTTGRLNIRWASLEVPAAGANVSVDYTYANRNSAAFSLTGFREGDFYLLALLDNGNNTFDAGEPIGIMEDQPFTLGHTTLTGVRVHIKDSAPGYGRFAWTASTASTSDYPVVINKISEQNAPTILTRAMRWPRNYFHEWDYQLQGFYGLDTGQYQWWMSSQQGTFSVSWPASMSTPYLVYPRGDQLNYAVNQLRWTMDSSSTRYHLQIARQASNRGYAMVLDQYYPTPYRDRDGVSQATLPVYAGELGDGVYAWRVASWNPTGESAWSDVQTFAINLSATNSHWIAGDIYYFGKADASNIYVEAFNNRGFSGKPEARILLNPTVARSNAFKGSFTLRGLEEGNYYVRAWLDVTPAGETRDGKRNSPWESWGFIRNPNDDYQPRGIVLLGTMFVDGTKLVIRDQDTDNDLLPDAWEMFYFGNLDQTGDMDYDGDGETNLEEYIRDGYDMNPAAWDTDGDGLSDYFEMNWTAPSFGFSAKSGLRLNPNLWDTDGDGYSDGAEMKRYRTDPLSSASSPRYQPMCFDAARSPGDYDGDGRSDLAVYDAANGNWYLMTAGGAFFTLPFGTAATCPMLGDYTGDGCDDFSLFNLSTGDWHLYDAWTGRSFSTKFGDSEMIPVPGDYTGDGRTDLAVYYPAEGTWFIYNLWTGQLFTLAFGGPSMIPVPGDYNNDGSYDLAVYEPNSGDWDLFAFDHYRREGRSYSGNFGGPTKIPVPGDYDGDGRYDIALFDTANANWYILTWRGQFLAGQFGCYGCIPVAGDYDGDGRTDVCVYYPPTGMWYIYCWSGRLYQVQFGWPAATPALKGR